MRSHDDCSCGFLSGMVVGGTLGAVLAILFLPKSGKEVRQEIMHNARALGDQARQWGHVFGRNALPAQAPKKNSKAAAKKKVAVKKTRTRKKGAVSETPKANAG